MTPTHGALVIALDRWGRVLLLRPAGGVPGERSGGLWCIPGGILETTEAPDEAALRAFEDETGFFLERLSLFRTVHRSELPGLNVDVAHVYFDDPDIAPESLRGRAGSDLRYFRPEDIPFESVSPPHTPILREFLAGAHYRRLFH